MDNDSDLKLPKKWRVFGTQQLQDTHDHMIRLRGEVYAHSAASLHPMTILPAGYDSKRLGRKVPQTSMELGSQTVPPESVIGFLAVARNLRERLEKAVFDEIDDLYGGMDLPARPFPVRFKKGDEPDEWL